MKMFKKLMAVVLTGALAVSMLTGCAITDAIAENNLKTALNKAYTAAATSGTTVTFEKTTKKAFQDEAKKVTNDITNNKKNQKVPTVVDGKVTADKIASVDTTNYTVVVLKAPSSTSVDGWNKIISTVTSNAKIGDGIYNGGTSTAQKAKFYVTTAEGTKENGSKNTATYYVLVFANSESAYNAK